MNLNVHSRTLYKFVEYIDKNHGIGLTREKVASACGISPSYLTELVHKELGFSYQELIIRTRMEYAKALLFATNLNFSEVADRLGISLFSSSRMFKKFTGMSPSEYCRSFRNYDFLIVLIQAYHVSMIVIQPPVFRKRAGGIPFISRKHLIK